jgi:hypothetical protein
MTGPVPLVTNPARENIYTLISDLDVQSALNLKVKQTSNCKKRLKPAYSQPHCLGAGWALETIFAISLLLRYRVLAYHGVSLLTPVPLRPRVPRLGQRRSRRQPARLNKTRIIAASDRI